MEYIGSIFEALKSFVVPHINHHWKLEDYMNELHEEVDRLNSRKRDRESEIEAEHRRGKRMKKEVDNWFKDVDKVHNEVNTIEEKFRTVSFFSRGSLGRFVCQSIEKVKEIYQQGNFINGLAIDGPPAIGVTLLAPELEGEVDVKERIWEYLMGDDVGMIGVCGMGGIGKTAIMKHINNRLLEESKKFDHVIWVTISKDLNIFKLQNVIADSLKQSDLLKDELQQRATTLKDILQGKRYVLILDDVWERLSLLDVGILEATLGMGRKVVLTSRSIDVCKSMGCEVVKVQPLSMMESMNLFLDHLGHNVVQDQNIKEIVNKIVEECGGLPLSLVTIAGSMKGVDNIVEWRNALHDIKKRVKSVKVSNTKRFERLKFSYDCMEDPKIHNFILYCSLFPEDFMIRKEELIKSWIDEGLLEGLEARQAMHDRGQSIEEIKEVYQQGSRPQTTGQRSRAWSQDRLGSLVLQPKTSFVSRHRQSTEVSQKAIEDLSLQSIPPGNLKQLLIAGAKALSENNMDDFDKLIAKARGAASICGEPIHRLGAYMVEGLVARKEASGSNIYRALRCQEPVGKDLLSYKQILYEICPYLIFGNMAANGAIVEACKTEDRIHIIDFQIAQGTQWVTLLQALAARPCGAPHVRITGIDDPLSNYARGGGLEAVGIRLAALSEKFNIPVEFHGVPVFAPDITREMLDVRPGEALAINFPLQLHEIPDESVDVNNPRDGLLRMIKSLSPKVTTLVEQESNTNTAPFLPRFIETLDYYLAMFESIDETLPRDRKERINVEQHCLARDIVNVIACEGKERVERHEVFGKWKSRLTMAGFRQYPLSSYVNSVIRGLLRCYSKHYTLVEKDGAMLLGWKDRNLISASAWHCDS